MLKIKEKKNIFKIFLFISEYEDKENKLIKFPITNSYKIIYTHKEWLKKIHVYMHIYVHSAFTNLLETM